MANIKDKIAKLLALAESPNEAEAKAALLKARELMAKNKLTPEECQEQKNQKLVKDFTDIQCTAMTNPWAASLSAVIADNYCCRAINRKRKGYKTATIGFIGLEDDFEICKRIFLYAYDCIASTCKREIKRNPWDDRGTYRKAVNAYGWGFCEGLQDAFKAQKAEHQEWGLVMVTPQAVVEEADGLGKPRAIGRNEADMDTLGARQKGYRDGLQAGGQAGTRSAGVVPVNTRYQYSAPGSKTQEISLIFKVRRRQKNNENCESHKTEDRLRHRGARLYRADRHDREGAGRARRRQVHHAGGNHHGPLCWAPAHSRGSGVHAELPEGGVIVAAKAKINTARDLFYFSDDIMRITGFSQSKSYKIIKQMNKELEAQGKLTFEGRVSKRYFNERLGLDVDSRQKSRA